MATITKEQLAAKAEYACTLKQRINALDELYKQALEEIKPFMVEGDKISTDLGTIELKEGKKNTVWLVPDSEKKEIQERQEQWLIANKKIKTKKGDPYIECRVNK